MTDYIIASAINSLTSFCLGLFCYLKDKRAPENKSFALLSLSIAIWSVGTLMRELSSNEAAALFWIRFLYCGSILIPVFFLYFMLSIVNKVAEKKKLLFVLYLCSFILLASNFSSLFVQEVATKLPFRYYGVPGIIYPGFIFYFLVTLTYAHYKLIKSFRKSTGLKRTQAKYVLLASSLGFVAGITTFLPTFNFNIFPFGNYFVSVYAFIVAYAIVKHRLMDIDIVIKKSITYSLLLLVLLTPCLVLVMLAQKFLFGSISYLFSFIVFVLFGIATFIFPIIKPGAEKTIEQILFKGKYDYKKTLSELSKAMISILDKRTLLKRIINTTTEAMGVEKASILLLDGEKMSYYLQSSIGIDKVTEESFKLLQNDLFITWLTEKGEIIVREELERYRYKREIQAVMGRLGDMESEICIPLKTGHELIGICNLGKKMSGDMFSHEDLDLLETLGNQAAVAIENAQLYEDLKKSEAQVRRADRLAALGTLTAGLAHEIRNPLVAIKTFTQLLPERFDDVEFRDHFLKITAGEVDRLSSLVTELLDFARPSEPNLQEENINDIAEKMIILISTQAKKKNLKIDKNYSEDMPSAMIDKEQIKQVLLNLFINAIDATSENGLITFGTRLITKNNSSNYVQMEIQDTGRGIPKDDIEQIFTPFFTTKHEGSGLGLSISYKIVEEHFGYIEVESKVGKGTTFYVNLPLNPSAVKGE